MTQTRVDEVLSGNAEATAPIVENATNDIDNVSTDPVEDVNAPKTNDNDIPEELPLAAEGDEVKEDSQATHDEYGNKIPKEKVYTQAELDARVNEVMRKRLKERHDEPPAKPVEKAAEGEENWEQQLENVVENTLSKVQQKKLREEQQARDAAIQVEFEEKFTRGMGRYSDFVDVVSKLPITDHMMIGTRGMKDPAAFIYAASKTQPKELERIAKLRDPAAQILEIGRLDERMRKARALTAAAKPLSQTRGDVAVNEQKHRSIDEKILNDANRKLRRRG